MIGIRAGSSAERAGMLELHVQNGMTHQMKLLSRRSVFHKLLLVKLLAHLNDDMIKWKVHVPQPCLLAFGTHLHKCQPISHSRATASPSASRSTVPFLRASSGQQGPQIAADFSDLVGVKADCSSSTFTIFLTRIIILPLLSG